MKHTISVLVENKFGVLARIAGLFSGRGYNIDSLSVAETMDPSVSQMTIVAQGEDRIIEQITKQLNKLVDVIKVQDYAGEEYIERELVLVKTHTTSETRAEVMQIVGIFRGKIVDVDRASVTVELTGTEDKIDALLNLLKPFGIRELVRTGKIAIAR
ncbi:MAG: acetolactate synthase small subunit [bacterium]|nr:acetolactate synthase small subunit [bacterium]